MKKTLLFVTAAFVVALSITAASAQEKFSKVVPMRIAGTRSSTVLRRSVRSPLKSARSRCLPSQRSMSAASPSLVSIH